MSVLRAAFPMTAHSDFEPTMLCAVSAISDQNHLYMTSVYIPLSIHVKKTFCSWTFIDFLSYVNTGHF